MGLGCEGFWKGCARRVGWGGAGYQEPSVAAISRGGLLFSSVGGVVRLLRGRSLPPSQPRPRVFLGSFFFESVTCLDWSDLFT